MVYRTDDIFRVKEESDIRTVCHSLGVNVTRKGRFYYMPCPFHTDSIGDGGSLSMAPGRGIWHCFGCNESGNIFKLYSQLKGYTDNLGNFARSVEEVHKICGLGFPLRSAGPRTKPVWKKMEPWVQELAEYEPLEVRTLEGHQIFVADGWLIPNIETLKKLPSEIKKLGINLGAKNVKYPLILRHIEEASCFVLTELTTDRPVAVFTADNQSANFAASRNIPRKLRGPELNGIEYVDDSPALFHTRLATENPIDWLVLVSLGLPACWGIWNIEDDSTPWGTPRLTIPCVIQVHVGDSPSRHKRFKNAVGGDWLPREIAIKKVETLTHLTEPQLLSVKEKILYNSCPVTLDD